MDKEKKMVEKYQKAFQQFGDSEQSLMWSKNKFENRFETLTSSMKTKENFSILDFGCGLAHLKEYLDDNCENYTYVGVDIISEFITHNKNKFKNIKFLKIESYEDINSNFDYIFISGVFNVLFKEDNAHQFDYIKDVLRYLFSKTNIYLAVNFMNKDVDYINDGSYHQDVKEIYDFVSNELSKRLIIDQSNMPYEFTLKVFKKLEKLDNIYKDSIQ